MSMKHYVRNAYSEFLAVWLQNKPFDNDTIRKLCLTAMHILEKDFPTETVDGEIEYERKYDKSS